MPLPLPPENPPSSAIQWSMDAGLVTPSATETRTGEIEVQVGGGGGDRGGRGGGGGGIGGGGGGGGNRRREPRR